MHYGRLRSLSTRFQYCPNMNKNKPVNVLNRRPDMQKCNASLLILLNVKKNTPKNYVTEVTVQYCTYERAKMTLVTPKYARKIPK